MQDTVVQELSERIKKAVDSTTEGLENGTEVRSCRFLPKNDLKEILCKKSLECLFKELFSTEAVKGIDNESGAIEESFPNVEDFADRTLGSPSRTSLLALFLYDPRTKCLRLFKDWLISDGIDFPSDNDLPFRKDQASSKFSTNDVQYILDYQAVFKPITIQQFQHNVFSSMYREPFLGARELIKDGSSGSVYKIGIAPCHWEFECAGNFFPTEKATTVAIKVFKQIDNIRTAQEATEDFETEKNILREIRESNSKHKMVLLDWGSITEKDEQDNTISHSLIFELAKCNLNDFFNDEAQTKTKKSVLLAKAVGLLEALAHLHDIFNILHLDIKPENILVFDGAMYRQNNENDNKVEFIWKLTDFGLARKKLSKPRDRIARSNDGSLASTLPASRPAGVYQAPEIQMSNSSKAGEQSDVWSMGCILLLLLAFIHDGPSEVVHLTHCLPVDFTENGGRESLFYLRSDTHQWKDVTCVLSYLKNFTCKTDLIPDLKLMAAVNPAVLTWSEVLFTDTKEEEKPIIRKALDIIFSCILVIDRKKRIQASELYRKFKTIRNRYEQLEKTPNSEDGHEQREEPNILKIGYEQLQEEQNPGNVHESLEETHGPEDDHEPLEEAQSSGDNREPLEQTNSHGDGYEQLNQTQSPSTLPQNSITAKQPPAHSAVCLAIKERSAGAIQRELRKDPEQIRRLCPECDQYPIHWALRNKAYKVLEILLEKATAADFKTECRESRQTPLELACAGSGDRQALQLLLKFHEKIVFTKDAWKKCKKGLGYSAKKVLEKLYKESNKV